MKTSRIFGVIFMLLIFASLPLLAKKKPPPIPLKELTDPDSPSYVPYPYPKTQFEIFEDFKYGVKILCSPREGVQSSFVAGFKDDREFMLGLLEDPPRLKITEIIKVLDLVDTSPWRYYYLLPVADLKGEVLAVGTLQDCGTVGGMAIYSKRGRFKPYKKENEVKAIISKTLGAVKIRTMERIGIHGTIGNRYSPIWRVITSTGAYFVDDKDNVYGIEGEGSTPRMGLTYNGPTQTTAELYDYSLEHRCLYLRKINNTDIIQDVLGKGFKSSLVA